MVLFCRIVAPELCEAALRSPAEWATSKSEPSRWALTPAERVNHLLCDSDDADREHVGKLLRACRLLFDFHSARMVRAFRRSLATGPLVFPVFKPRLSALVRFQEYNGSYRVRCIVMPLQLSC